MNPLRAVRDWIGRQAERRFLGGPGSDSFAAGAFGLGAGLSTPVLSGVAVSPESALTFTACFACINVLSTDLASLPLEVKRRRKEGGRVAVPSDPRYNLVFCEPNRNVTSFRFRQAILGHRFGWGNGYAEIRRSNGMPAEIWLHHPGDGRTWPELSRSGSLWYQVDGGRRQVRAEDMLHFAGLGFTGLKGYSPIALHRQAVGYGIAAERFGAAFYGNAATPRGALKLAKKLTPEGLKNLRESWAAVHSDTDNAHRLAILEEGTEYQQLSISPGDAEYLATRQFQAIEMCRIFRVPPPRIMDFSGVSSVYKALADMIDDYLSSTLGPEVEGMEQEWNRKLFTSRERAGGLHVAHDFSALLRGNAKDRMAYFKNRLECASITPDEIREREGDNPFPGRAGDRVYLSTSLSALDDAGFPVKNKAGDK